MTQSICTSRRRYQLIVGALVALIVLAGCGSNGTGSPTGAVAPTEIAAPSGVNSAGTEVVLEVVDGGEATGLVITDRLGFVVYGNTGETVTSLVCLDDCTSVWIPLTSEGRTTVSDSLDPTQLGLVERPDGITQVSYAGVPLYLWTGDDRIGITGGAGVAGTWFALTETAGFVE